MKLRGSDSKVLVWRFLYHVLPAALPILFLIPSVNPLLTSLNFCDGNSSVFSKQGPTWELYRRPWKGRKTQKGQGCPQLRNHQSFPSRDLGIVREPLEGQEDSKGPKMSAAHSHRGSLC